MVEIRRASPDQADTLKAIAVASKAYWGYPADWMERWASRVQISPGYVAAHHVYVAADGPELAGWYALKQKGDLFVLDHLWVLPRHIGQGIGGRLFLHARSLAEELGGRLLELEADPHAVGFYERMGARRLRTAVGDMGRPLPVMGMELGRWATTVRTQTASSGSDPLSRCSSVWYCYSKSIHSPGSGPR